MKILVENPRRILRSYKTRSTFSTENTLCKLLYKSEDRIATDNKEIIIYKTDCSNCEAVYFGESKRSLKLCLDEHKISVENYVIRMKLQNTVGKHITALAGIK